MASRNELAVIVVVLLAIKYFRRGEPWWTPAYSKKGGTGAGPGASTLPVPQGAANVWSLETMKLFRDEIERTNMDPEVVLLGISAASNFNTDEQLGSYVGLLMVARDDLAQLGYPGVPPFEEIDAPHQIPWLAKVIAYRIASTGGIAPTTVPELAVLLHPSTSPQITEAIRNEATRRAEEQRGTMLYMHHLNLLRSLDDTP